MERNKMLSKMIPYCCLWFLLVLPGLAAMAQSEPESSENMLLFQDAYGKPKGKISQGDKVTVIPKDWNAPHLRGTLEQITDSTLVVKGKTIAIEKIEGIKGQSLSSPRQALPWFLATLACLPLSFILFLLAFLTAFAGLAALSVIFIVLVLLVSTFFWVALALTITYLISGNRSYFSLRYYCMRVARYVRKF